MQLITFIEYLKSTESNLYDQTVTLVRQWLKGDELDTEQLFDTFLNIDLSGLVNNSRNLTTIERQRTSLISLGQNTIGGVVAPFLFVWNIRRVEDYVENGTFNASWFIDNLTEMFNVNKDLFIDCSTMHWNTSPISKEKTKVVYESINGFLSKFNNQNEYIGTVKIAHIINPYAFPLLDNKIAKGTKLIGFSERMSMDACISWITKSSLMLSEFSSDQIGSIESQTGLSLLRCLDMTLMHYRLGAGCYNKKCSFREVSNQNKAHISNLGIKI
ncbi:hypothetical protein [Vibrio campbellii]|uniref:hypothetical protein n=1 Tax=Vibrio campbellii TaxID=680 RepID=UPI0037DD8E67